MKTMFRLAVTAIWMAALLVQTTTARGAEKSPDWPCWRGPNGNGSAPDPGFTLVDDMSKARLLWTSEEEIASDCKGRWAGGFSSPVVADGRVFLFCYKPHGRTTFEYNEEDKKTGGGRNPTSEWHADDVVHCFDAQTGKTLWKFMDERGLIGGHWKESGHYTPCADGGRVYVVGTTGRLYALDAARGKLAWEYYLDDKYKDAFERSKAAGKSVFNRQGFNPVPCAVDGVVAITAGGVVGLEGASGRKLWGPVKTAGGRSGRGIGSHTAPVVWTHKGTRYFVAGNTAIEPKTGKVLWQIPDADTTTAPCVTEDYYICSGIAAPKGSKGQAAGSTCFRITPEKFEKVWSLPPGRSPTMGCTDVVCGPYFVQEGSNLPAGEGEKGQDAEAADTQNGKVTILVVEMATGKRVASMPGFRKFGYSPLSCQGMIFGGLYTLTHFKIGPTEFRQLAVPELPGRWNNSCSPALAGGRLYYRTVKNLVCYDLRDYHNAPASGTGK